ncbi:translation initiation factor IF-2 [Streptomyces sp. 1114.5]|uniref:hypothetical protein n=1 Tax=Streptomyces sp. 1114.5 TaxID=1938830 RepID=UPI000F193FFC|nr:hypothetical protein [Streptomyces sp. 1114.5]RKT16548.1 translation initiation factor IF-2 [Streptomyces sp. 1114.5]
MGTSTAGNRSQNGAAAGIQLPSVAWEMEEGPAGAGPVAPAAPPAVPQYGQVAAVPASLPDPGPDPDPEATAEAEAEPAGPAPSGRRARLKRPVIIAAATVGVVLMGLPFLVTDGGKSGRGGSGNGGHSTADRPPVEGPELDDLAQPPAPADPVVPVPGAPAGDPTQGQPATPGGDPAVPGAPVVPGGPPGTTTGTVPGAGTAPGTGSSPLTRPNPGAPAPGGNGGGSSTGAGGGSGPAPGTGSGSGTVPAPAPQPPAPGQPPAPQQPPAAGKPAPPSFSAIGGNGCGNSAVSFAKNGWWTQGTAGWLSNSAGGYTGSGCNGSYVSLPMSGAANKDDPEGNSAVWTFSTAPVTSGSCRISVYVPNNGDLKAVGGKPSYYTVANASGGAGAFNVDQPANRGNWYDAGPFPVSGGRISVTLHSRGIDWGGSADKAHHAAAAVRADCTG